MDMEAWVAFEYLVLYIDRLARAGDSRFIITAQTNVKDSFLNQFPFISIITNPTLMSYSDITL